VPFVNTSKPFHSTLKVAFSNKGDGIQSFIAPPFKGSALRLPRYAPENGYEPTLIKEMGRLSLDKPIDWGYREDQNYFFRVRTVTDDSGKIKSALYGKIERDISSGFEDSKTAVIVFSYYFNPTPNDRNMEFARAKNLFKNLPSLEQP
jgi:hypothetical protein